MTEQAGDSNPSSIISRQLFPRLSGEADDIWGMVVRAMSLLIPAIHHVIRADTDNRVIEVP